MKNLFFILLLVGIVVVSSIETPDILNNTVWIIFVLFMILWWLRDVFKSIEYLNKKTKPPKEGFGSGDLLTAYYFVVALKKFAVFEGRASRAEFWNFYCLMLILVFLSIKLDVHLFDVPEGWGPAYIVTSIILFIPTLSIGARRLHDVGKSGWWQLISLTGIGVILLIAWWASKSVSVSYSKKIKTEKTSSKSKLAEELKELKELYNDGTLSKKEFTKAKNKLLK